MWPAGRQNVQVTYDHGYGGARGRAYGGARLASRLIVQGVASGEAQGNVSVHYGQAARTSPQASARSSTSPADRLMPYATSWTGRPAAARPGVAVALGVRGSVLNRAGTTDSGGSVTDSYELDRRSLPR